MPEQKSTGWTNTNHTYAWNGSGTSSRCLFCDHHADWHFYVPDDEERWFGYVRSTTTAQ